MTKSSKATTKPFEINDIKATAVKNIQDTIIDEIDNYNAAVAAGNNELAQMIHLNLQGLKRRLEFASK